MLVAVAASVGDARALSRWSSVAVTHLETAGLEGPRLAVEHLAARHGLFNDPVSRSERARWVKAHAVGDPEVMLSMFLPTLREVALRRALEGGNHAP